jgi:hypothetical protein
MQRNDDVFDAVVASQFRTRLTPIMTHILQNDIYVAQSLHWSHVPLSP